MESSKVINKVIVTSLAFGVSCGVGFLITEKNIQKSLLVGGLAGTAGLVGASVAGNKKEELPEGVNSLAELKEQEANFQKSLDDIQAKVADAEQGFSAIQSQHNDLVSVVDSLDQQKQGLETECQSYQEQIDNQQTELETTKQEQQRVAENVDSLRAEVVELTKQKAELEQIVTSAQNDLIEAEEVATTETEEVIAPLVESLAVEEIIELESGEATANNFVLGAMGMTAAGAVALSGNNPFTEESEVAESTEELVEQVGQEEVVSLLNDIEAEAENEEILVEEDASLADPFSEVEEISPEEEVVDELLSSIDDAEAESLMEEVSREEFVKEELVPFALADGESWTVDSFEETPESEESDEPAILEMAEEPAIEDELTEEPSFLEELSSFESFDDDEEVEETVFLDESSSTEEAVPAEEAEFLSLEMAEAPEEEASLEMPETEEEPSFLDELSSFESFDDDEEVEETVFLDESLSIEEDNTDLSSVKDDSVDKLTELLPSDISLVETENSSQDLENELVSVSDGMDDFSSEDDIFGGNEELEPTEILLEESIEISELEDVEQKLNTLDQISAESLDELQDLLGSVQEEELELEEQVKD